MAAFSSRGPGGNFLKPDVTAPGVQILAGHTPTPESDPRRAARPATSRPSPAPRCRRPTTPARPSCSRRCTRLDARRRSSRRSMTTAMHERGQGGPRHAGRPVRLRRRPHRPERRPAMPGLTFDETAADMATLANDPIERGGPQHPVDRRSDHAGHAITITGPRRTSAATRLKYTARTTARPGRRSPSAAEVRARAGRVHRADHHDQVGRDRRRSTSARSSSCRCATTSRRCTCRSRSAPVRRR